MRRMTEEQSIEYRARAKDLFDIDPCDDVSDEKCDRVEAIRVMRPMVRSKTDKVSLLWNEEVTSLLFGVISDKPEVVAGLVSDIGKIRNSRLLLLANGLSWCI